MRKNILLFGILILVACGGEQMADNRGENEFRESFLIAYNVFVPDSVKENNYEIFSVDLKGVTSSQLTDHPDVAWTYLAIDDKILFISDRDTCYRCFFLYQMDSDGSEIVRVTDFQLKDSWMSSRNNGEELIVTPAHDSTFYIINRSGEILRRVPTGKVYFNDPCFSPNGSLIVFRGANAQFKDDSGYIDELYIMNSDGSQLRQITSYPERDTTAKWYNYHAGPPRWHPTENFISYQSKQDGKSSLFATTPNGSKHWRLIDSEYNEGWHDWSPDGKFLAFETSDLSQGQYHINLMDWQTKKQSVLTDTSYRLQQAPVFVRKATDKKDITSKK